MLDNTPWALPTTATLDAAGDYGQSSPPADLNQWSAFIQGFAQQLVSLNIATGTDALRFRQGTECNFIDRFNGTQAQYNAQYAASATAVKSVFPNAQFGPFNAAVNSRVTHAALATYCKTNNLPFDFAPISFYELANTGTNKFVDSDTNWTNTIAQWATIETNLGRSVSREIHEFGVLLNEYGMSTSEPGSWGAAWTFNILMKLYASGLQRSSHWDSAETIAGTNSNPTISALKGDGWVYTVLDSLAGGQWTYLTPPAASPAGTSYTSVCVTKGNRVYVVVSALNVVTAGNAARSLDSRNITVSLPKSVATLADSRTLRYTALTRSTALYDLIRADLDAQHPEYFIADTGTVINWSTKPGLTANVATMAGTTGKTWVASNWTTGQNYRQKVVDSLTLKTFTGVGTVTNQTSSYNLTFPMENAAVMVIAIDNLPTISIAATDPTAAEPGTDTGTFTVTRSSGATWATTVNLALTGTATQGTDYTPLATTLTFTAGETSKTLTVTPLDDALAESAETVIATLAAGSEYTVAASPAGTATVTIADNPNRTPPSISVAPTASSITYGQSLASSTLSGGSASVPGTFTFTTPSTTPALGTALQGYTFTPTDAANTNLITGTVSVTVTPVITTTWTGSGTDTNWGSAANWGGNAPVAGNRLAFAGATQLANVNNLAADTAFAGINFTNDPGVTAGNFTLSGNRLTLGGDIVTTGNATTGNNAATLSLALVLNGNRTLTANTKHTLTLSGAITEIGGARSLTKEGAASLTLAGSNSFSGGFTLNNGTVSVNAPAALGTGPLGWAITGNAVTLTFTTTGGTVNNAINWGTGSITINANQGNVAALVFANSGFTSAVGNKTLTLQGSSTAANDFQNLIPEGTGSTTVAMNGAGNWKLSNDSNAFSGQLQVLQGTLTITSLADTGNVSAVGTGAVTPTIRLGSGTGDGALNSVGSGNVTSNRSVQIGNGSTSTFTGGARITNNGTGSLVFTAASFNPAMASGTPARTLTLGGANPGANEIRGVIQNNAATGPVSVTKINTGSWTLSGNNTYTGNTMVSAGTLSLANPYLADTASVSVSIGAALNLAFAGTDTISKLLFDGIEQYQGTWGSQASSASRKTAAITGTGLLNVTLGPVETVTVTLGNLNPTYNGSPKAVSATTSPQAGLAVAITYNGSSTAPTAVGNYSVVATVTTAGYVGSASGTLVIVTAFDAWASGYGLTGAGALATADPDGDGLPNLIEYALGLPPAVANANPITLSQVTVSGGTYLQLSVSRNPLVTSVLIEGLSAGTLSDANAWSTVTTVDDPSNSASVFIVRDSVPISTTGKRFLRLRFTLQP